jgi:hypothetical protein
MFSNQMKGVLFDYGLPANLNRIGIVGMSRADDLVSFVSPRSAADPDTRGGHNARPALRKQALVASARRSSVCR